MANSTYAINFRDSSGQTHRTANRFVFDSTADDNTGAGAVYAGLKGAVNYVRASMTKYLSFQNEGTTHPAGTRHSATIYLFDAAGNIQKLTVRNLKDTVDKAAVTAAFVGNCSVVGGGPVTRVSFSDRTLPGSTV